MNDNELVTKFEAYLLTEKRVAKNTYAAYKRDINQLLKFLREQKLTIATTSVPVLKDFLRWLHEAGMTARSLSRKISTLKAFYGFLSAHHDFDNLARELTFPKLEQRLPEYLTEEQIQQLLKTADNDVSALGIRNKVMLYLLYTTGMRISELVNLCVPQVQFDTGFIVVAGKGGKDRMVPIPESMLELLRTYITQVRHVFLSSLRGAGETQYMFPIVYGKKIKSISRQAFWSVLKKLAKESGYAGSLSPHKLRHSLATHLLRNGADLRSLQLLLGHENISTVQVYTHLDTEQVRGEYDGKFPRS